MTKTTELTFLMGMGYTPDGLKFHTSIVTNGEHTYSIAHLIDEVMHGKVFFILQNVVDEIAMIAQRQNLGMVRINLVNGLHVNEHNEMFPMWEYNEPTVVGRLEDGLQQLVREINGIFIGQNSHP